jgi:hypothetical protein
MSSRPPNLPHRRRVDRVGGVLLAVLGVVVAVVALVALRHPNGRQATAVPLRTSTVTSTSTQTTTRTAQPSTHASSSPHASGSASPAAHSIPLVVLNDTSRTGLAETAKTRFQTAGWTVTSTGNISNDILSTCAYYDPTDPANQQAAIELQKSFPAIKRVKEKFPELPAGPIVVVLTSDYS